MTGPNNFATGGTLRNVYATGSKPLAFERCDETFSAFVIVRSETGLLNMTKNHNDAPALAAKALAAKADLQKCVTEPCSMESGNKVAQRTSTLSMIERSTCEEDSSYECCRTTVSV